MIDLSDKTAVVTGASQGLGKAVAVRLHQAGANVVINYVDSPDGRNRTNAHGLAGPMGSRAAAVQADVRDPDAVSRMFGETVSLYGGVDIVVNNAGIIRDKTVRNMSFQQWQEVIDTNLTGVFHVCQAAVEAISDGGRIVNFSSISAVLGSYGQANYSASKAGVMGLTKVLSRELGKRQVTVNAVAPGVIMTEMSQTIPQNVLDQMLAQIPLQRFGQPDDVADVVLFLCSDLARYVTGQTIHVNGGWIG